MAKSIIITNGTGSGDLVNGTYTVSSQVNGYDNTTLDPTSITVDTTTNDYAFTIAATGTLTLHVTEDGTTSGTPIVGATFIRTDAAGTEYGSAITTNDSGNAVFENVPFSATDAPLVYYKQTSSDGYHEFSTDVVNTSLETNTKTVEIVNANGPTRNITLTDSNYSNMPIASGTLTFTTN